MTIKVGWALLCIIRNVLLDVVKAMHLITWSAL